jgi:hypothetical protein
MNHLRKGRWSDPSAAINEPGSIRFSEAALLTKDLQGSSQDALKKVINDYWSLNQR